MIKHSNVSHELQIREKNGEVWSTWRPAIAGMYREPRRLAYHGQLSLALDAVEIIHIEQYGDMHGVDFRCVTRSRTVTLRSGEASPERMQE
jgi:hypothetical protein